MGIGHGLMDIVRVADEAMQKLDERELAFEMAWLQSGMILGCKRCY